MQDVKEVELPTLSVPPEKGRMSRHPLGRKGEMTEKYHGQGSWGTFLPPPSDKSTRQQPLKASLSLISGCHHQNSRLVTELPS